MLIHKIMITRKTLLKGTFEVLSLQKEEPDAAEDLIFTSFLPEDEEERRRRATALCISSQDLYLPLIWLCR